MAYQGQVTTGSELNAYQGNAALGTGEGAGYKEIDLSPLQVFALTKYKTNLIDYEQQQKDKKALMEQFSDPELYQFVDKELADQIDPDLNELKQLAKENLQMHPNSEKWYRFHELHNKIVEKNANAKVVQTLKDKYRKDSGDSADPHEKEKMDAYVKQLNGYKLGDDIPAYQKYHPYEDSHMPTGGTTITGTLPAKSKKAAAAGGTPAAAGTVSTGTKETIDGDSIVTTKASMTNPIWLNRQYDQLEVTTPQATETWKDVAHTTLETMGVGNLNDAMRNTYEKSMILNTGELQKKYATEYAEYIKKHSGTKGTPNVVAGKVPPSFKQFMIEAGHGDEFQNVRDGHKFLEGQIDYIPVAPGERELAGYSYVTDPQTGEKTRLSRSDKEIAAIFGATRNTPGVYEQVSSEISKLPAEINKLKAETGLVGEQKKTQKSIQAKNYAAAKKYGRQTAVIPPLPPSELPLIGRQAVLSKLPNGEQQLIVDSKSLPLSLRKRVGFSLLTTAQLADKKVTDPKTGEEKMVRGGETAQMRFYDSNGTDVTYKALNKMMSTGTGTLQKNILEAVQSATANGLTVKFIDQHGNIIGTTQEIDKQTIEEDLKATNSKDPKVGTNLPTDEDE